VKWPPLPRVLKTPLKNYEVTEVDGFDTDEQLSGLTDNDHGTIKVSRDMCIEHQWETLFHEVIHVAEFLTGMKPLKDSKNDSDVERLAMGLCMIFAANGWIGGKSGQSKKE